MISEERWTNQCSSMNYTEDGKRILNFTGWHKKIGNVKGQQWIWLGRWTILEAWLLIKWKMHKKDWKEDDKGNYLYCIHTCRNLDVINRAGK